MSDDRDLGPFELKTGTPVFHAEENVHTSVFLRFFVFGRQTREATPGALTPGAPGPGTAGPGFFPGGE